MTHATRARTDDGRGAGPPGGSLRTRAARGALVTLAAQALRIVLQLAGVVLLARLLLPSDYGLVAMVMALIGVAEIFRDLGLSSAAVQAEHLSRAQRDNLFWVNTAAGGVLALLVVAVAPLIARWYAEPELVDLARALAPVFLLNGLATQFRADLTRRMRFSRIATADVLAPCLALGAAIAVAAAGGGYWALVTQQLTTAVVLLVVLAVSARWWPRWYTRDAPMRELLSYGWHLAGSQLIGYVARNIDSVTIGTRFGATPLGLYNRAFQLLMTPLAQLRNPTVTVALPVLSRIRESRSETDAFVRRGQLALGLTLVAGLGVVAGAAAPLTAIMLGPAWEAAEPYLRLLAAAGAFQTLAYVGYWVYLAHGLTKELLRYSIVSAALTVTCVLVGSIGGPVGVAWGFLAATALEWPISFWWLSRKANVSVRPLVIGALRIVALAAVLGVAAWAACTLVGPSAPWVQLAAAVGAAGVVYVVALALPSYRRDVRDVVAVVRAGLAARQSRAPEPVGASDG
ncbi:polysaccharide biosynthesis protein [Beutenbergia cavernae DSM 12333]|uniref:Polysaccharide biosynthesis protein n=1 Tax=Beutenbergia cavernae (strain ATCC BAA-8 / DSM 12333 / CCUG 43141 / JCM 11478 / NBRC 16432 / NCIMB 13614 / HKI 0122) TaxID=471853 RepID=C5C079_BEUC1|nr:lipopolysaccharide biosynthesis protein [Beutenbergia cavernae]ACQ79265.1 polysaccharide biosynthesis protein [Beutenbergia cavernae DSM 12333]